MTSILEVLIRNRDRARVTLYLPGISPYLIDDCGCRSSTASSQPSEYYNELRYLLL